MSDPPEGVKNFCSGRGVPTPLDSQCCSFLAYDLFMKLNYQAVVLAMVLEDWQWKFIFYIKNVFKLFNDLRFIFYRLRMLLRNRYIWKERNWSTFEIYEITGNFAHCLEIFSQTNLTYMIYWKQGIWMFNVPKLMPRRVLLSSKDKSITIK